MQTQNWKIFSKTGSNLNLFADSYLNLEFVSTAQNATGASAYALTNPDGSIVGVKVTNSGWEYDPATQVNLSYTFGNNPGLLSPAEASINFSYVRVFKPEDTSVLAIGSVNIDLSTAFVYPSVSFAAAIFLNPVSQGLVETEHLSFLENANGQWIRPYDNVNSTLVFQMDSEGDEEIKFFEVDEASQLVIWSEQLVVDTSIYAPNTPLMINIGFRADDEGVFERKMRVYHQINDQLYLLYEILINAESIGPDERFDTLITNFGLPSPKANHQLFKEADINEALPNWQLLNQKGKHIILEHDKIMPFIGTYKALINAIKWLGYEDISVKEWFRNVKDGKQISLTVPYEAADRTKTILYFTPEERRNLKKLNQLSLVYCLTRETGQIDEWGNPEIEECYNYNIDEIFVKLYSLKQWLERWIIGVNCRITDITGEGIYLDNYKNIIYSTQNYGQEAIFTQSLTPTTVNPNSELVTGDASILLTLKEFQITNISSTPKRFGDYAAYAWNPTCPSAGVPLTDLSYLANPLDYILVGSSAQFPLSDLFDFQWKLSVEKTDAGVVTNNLVTNPLFVYENEIKYWNILDSYSKFYDVSTNLNILLERAFLRDASKDKWEDSMVYSIYPDATIGGYRIDDASGNHKWLSFGYINLVPDTSGVIPNLIYAVDPNYRAPLLSMENYKFTDASDNVISFQHKYFLDILDGKIAMDSSMLGSKGEVVELENYINWNYDTSLDEQKITFNLVYRSPRMSISVYDPSIYWDAVVINHQDPFNARVVDNSIYQMNVHHTGNYDVEIYGWDGQNTIYNNNMKTLYPVWNKFPTILSYMDNSCNSYLTRTCVSTYLSPADVSTLINNNLLPLFDRQIPLEGLTLEKDINGNIYINVPSITYFQDLPTNGAIARFYNLTEECFNLNSSTLIVNTNFQSFYKGDNVILVQWDKHSLSFIQEASAKIIADPSIIDIDLGEYFVTLDNIPANFIGQDASTEVYILNDTERVITNPVNDLLNRTINLDVSGYQFEQNQLVGLIISDISTGYRWGSSFRVLDVSINHHTLQGNVPQFILNNSSRYDLTAKHAFSTFANFQLEVSVGYEVDNNFHLYMTGNNYHQYYLDNTFVFVDVLFDHEYVLEQWYDPSTDNLIGKPYYPFTKAVTVDISTLVILGSYFDPSNYMLEQKNIWTLKHHEDGTVMLRVYNDYVPFIFNQAGIFDVQLEAYDKYGNIKSQVWDGLLTVQ